MLNLCFLLIVLRILYNFQLYKALWTSKINTAIIDYIFFYGLFLRISSISNEILLNPLFYSVSKASPLGGNLFPFRWQSAPVPSSIHILFNMQVTTINGRRSLRKLCFSSKAITKGTHVWIHGVNSFEMDHDNSFFLHDCLGHSHD